MTTSGTSPFNRERRSNATGSATTTSACTRNITPGVNGEPTLTLRPQRPQTRYRSGCSNPTSRRAATNSNASAAPACHHPRAVSREGLEPHEVSTFHSAGSINRLVVAPVMIRPRAHRLAARCTGEARSGAAGRGWSVCRAVGSRKSGQVLGNDWRGNRQPRHIINKTVRKCIKTMEIRDLWRAKRRPGRSRYAFANPNQRAIAFHYAKSHTIIVTKNNSRVRGNYKPWFAIEGFGEFFVRELSGSAFVQIPIGGVLPERTESKCAIWHFARPC